MPSSPAQLSLLEEISQLLMNTHEHQEVLDQVVQMVSRRLETDVCSLYMLNDKKTHLTLKASRGLKADAVDHVCMSIEEGLTGLAIETLAPVAVADAAKNERYKYFPESGEEAYASFLGVPLIFRKDPLGVLVIQRREIREFTNENIAALVTIASQLTGVIVNSSLFQSLESTQKEAFKLKHELKQAKLQLAPDSDAQKNQPISCLHGQIGSSGIGIGKAVILEEGLTFDSIEEEYSQQPQFEKSQFEKALADSIEQVSAIMSRVNNTLSDEDSAIFHAHLMILEDNSFKKKIDLEIQGGLNAPSALKLVVSRYTEAFLNLDDQYLRERANDMQDVGRRILGNLLGIHPLVDSLELEKDSIIVAKDMTPSQLISLNLDHVRGFILAEGGITSHFTILAKSFGKPALLGVDHCMKHIRENDKIILDCNEGVLHVHPNESLVEEYYTTLRSLRIKNDALEKIKSLPSETTDGEPVELLANVGLIKDLELAEHYNAQGIGLYRTEFQFLTRSSLPTEQEQYSVYKNILKSMNGKMTIIRTLDIGGDKFLPYMKAPEEQNPFLGWRSIRISLDRIDLFKTQLRALIRASVHGNLKIMLPMISGLDELRKSKAIIEEVKEELRLENIKFSDSIPVGIMLEVPSAVRMAARLIKECDFFSVGTNDLTQYTLAVDRNNKMIAHLYDGLHPAILVQLQEVAAIAKAAGKPISICGEMAGDLCSILPLIGFGIRTLSMNSARIPLVKEVIRNITVAEAEKVAAKVIEMDTPAEIRAFLKNEVKQYMQ